MSDAANPAAHNTDNALRDALQRLAAIPASRGEPPTEFARGADAAYRDVERVARAALSAAPPNDPLGRLATWADENDDTIAMLEIGLYDATKPKKKWIAETRDMDGKETYAFGATAHDAAAALLAALAGTPEAPGA